MNITRRSAIKGAVASATALSAPAILSSKAFASSGSVRVFAWVDYVQANMIEAFESKTGIKVELSTYGSNDEAEQKLQASQGKGFDVIFPSITNRAGYDNKDAPNGVWLMPLDENKIAIDNIIPSFVRDSIQLGGVKDGKRFLLPFNWGTEGLTFNAKEMDLSGDDLSFGALWAPEAKGKAAFRQKSVLFGTGLYLDAMGKLNSNRMLDVYKSEDDMRRVMAEITKFVIEHKENFGAFWNNATEATSAFSDAGCVVGQTWDTTGLLLNQENGDFKYRAPKEGIITWLDSVGIPSGAENIEQAYEFVNFMLTPEMGGMLSNNTGYNSAVVGASEFTSEQYKKQFGEVYTNDVLGNMWWWQADTPYFAAVRNEFVEQITNA